MPKTILKKLPSPPPRKGGSIFWKFIFKSIAYIIILLFLLNGIVDVLEGTFYRRYQHYLSQMDITPSFNVFDFMKVTEKPLDEPEEPSTKIEEKVIIEEDLVKIPETTDRFKEKYPLIPLFGEKSNHYFIGEDGYRCEILNRSDMDRSVCTETLSKPIKKLEIAIPKENEIFLDLPEENIE